MSNYRPIALIPVFSKIFEKVIYKSLYSYLEKSNILVKQQKGFRKQKTINMAIHDLLLPILSNMDSRKPVCAIFTDLTKAFDYVDYSVLLYKLERYGIRGNVLELFRSYLTNRRQFVEITQICSKTCCENKYKSESEIIKYGVPQGSVLGPLLFLVYINDLPEQINHPMVLFADDSTIVIECDNPNTYGNEINMTLNKMISWFEKNNLKINLEKTKIMHFYQRIPNNNLNINYLGTTIEPVTTIKFLGINIDNNLTWRSQTDEVCKKLNKFTYVLYKLSKIVNLESVLAAYHGYVVSVLRYGVIYWGNSVDRESVFRAQKRCVRAMCGLNIKESCQPFFIRLKILTLPSLYIYETNVFVKTNLSLYKIATKSYYRKLRDKNKSELEVTHGKTALMNKSILSMAQKIFNKLPETIKTLNLDNFKKELLKILINKCYYSVKAYLDDNSIITASDNSAQPHLF